MWQLWIVLLVFWLPFVLIGILLPEQVLKLARAVGWLLLLGSPFMVEAYVELANAPYADRGDFLVLLFHSGVMLVGSTTFHLWAANKGETTTANERKDEEVPPGSADAGGKAVAGLYLSFAVLIVVLLATIVAALNRAFG